MGGFKIFGRTRIKRVLSSMKLREVTNYLEEWAPRAYQESYDNSGLLFGDRDKECTKCLICLDITEEVVQEAQAKQADLIISHHPLIFGGIKSLTGKNAVERALVKAIQADIALYAIHTNLDNVATGVNQEIARKLGVGKPEILMPKKGLLKKLVVFVPQENRETFSQALWKAGAGSVGNYQECSFYSPGTGTFKGGEGSQPSIGEPGKLESVEEYRLEFLVEQNQLTRVLSAMHQHHPYEEVAYEIYPIENPLPSVGSGMHGQLPEPISTTELLQHLKASFGGVVRYTKPLKEKVQHLAWCGGSGSFLLEQAKRVGAEVFISSDFKYHQFFEADNEILIADIGHFENEQFTIDLIGRHLQEKFPTFAVLLTENSTNPINYL